MRTPGTNKTSNLRAGLLIALISVGTFFQKPALTSAEEMLNNECFVGTGQESGYQISVCAPVVNQQSIIGRTCMINLIDSIEKFFRSSNNIVDFYI